MRGGGRRALGRVGGGKTEAQHALSRLMGPEKIRNETDKRVSCTRPRPTCRSPRPRRVRLDTHRGDQLLRAEKELTEERTLDDGTKTEVNVTETEHKVNIGCKCVLV